MQASFRYASYYQTTHKALLTKHLENPSVCSTRYLVPV